MATLEQDIEQLDTQIAAMRAQHEASHDNTERAKLQRQIDMLNVHERAAIRQHYAERAAKRAAEEKAGDLFQQHRADQQEAQDRALLRRRWTGDEKSFNEAYVDLLKQLRMDRALGRAVDSGAAYRILVKRPTQRQVEKAWRIRQLSNGGIIPDATAAERQAAAKRRAIAQQRKADQESTG
jgi:hypothetical protein